MSRFETEVLTEEENLDGLARLNDEWVDRAMALTSHQRVILDMDSSESPVHGQQEGVACNGHFESVCYHPLFLFTQCWAPTETTSGARVLGCDLDGVVFASERTITTPMEP